MKAGNMKSDTAHATRQSGQNVKDDQFNQSHNSIANV